MLPNELINKIFKYRYQDFKKFLLKIKKINQEYKEKFKFVKEDHILRRKIRDNIGYYFPYNYRHIYYSNCGYTHVLNPEPQVHEVCELNKNY